MAVRPAKFKNTGKNEGVSLFVAAKRDKIEAAKQAARDKRDEAEARRRSWEARQEILKRKLIRIYVLDDCENDQELQAYHTAVMLNRNFVEGYDFDTHSWTFAVKAEASKEAAAEARSKPVEIGVNYS